MVVTRQDLADGRSIWRKAYAKTERGIYSTMKTLMILAVLFLVGCKTTYHVEVQPDGTVIADTSSSREYDYFSMTFNPATNQFEVIAIGVTDDTSEIVKAGIQAGAGALQ